MSFYAGKRVLVTGGTGTVGTPLVRRLRKLGALVKVVSIDQPDRVAAVLDDPSIFEHGDLRDYETCLRVTENQEFVFHLIAVKSNTQLGMSRSASEFVPPLLCNTNVMEAAFQNRVQRYMFVGSINEYPPLDIRHEDDVWKGAPEANDRFNGIVKRVGEVQGETYLHEHGWDAVRIVRLSNVYGPYDDFDPKTSHVIPSLINRVVNGENPLRVSGDGSAIRDFIFSEDVVDGMLLSLEKSEPCTPTNLGSGKSCSIKELVETLLKVSENKPEVVWDPSRPRGDSMRVLDVQRAKDLLGYETKTSLEDGLAQTVEWYISNKSLADRRGQELHG